MASLRPHRPLRRVSPRACISYIQAFRSFGSAEEIHLGLCQPESGVGVVPDGFWAIAGEMPIDSGRVGMEKEISVQEQADESRFEHD